MRPVCKCWWKGYQINLPFSLLKFLKKRRKQKMLNFNELVDIGLKFHGHKCTAMPMGLKAGLYAMEKLGVESVKDGQLHTILEIR